MRQAVEHTGCPSRDRGDSAISGLGWISDQVYHDDGITVYFDGIVNVADLFPGGDQADRSECCRQLIRSYKRHGMGVLHRLRGSFAIAFWDTESRRFLMAVDPFGTRTLFYSSVENAFAFSPRLAALLKWDKFRADVDLNTIYFYLNHAFCPGPFTIYRAARRLEPGQCLQWEAGRFRIERYWDMSYPEDQGMPESAAAEALRQAIEDSVRAHFNAADQASVHRGAFLSGGTDSSTLVGLLSAMSSDKVQTFSVGFRESGYNELDYARIAAQHFNAEPHEYLLSPDQALDAIPIIAQAFEEPFGNSSAIPTYFCLKMAHESGVNLMFAGDGGDELFAGNERYVSEKVFSLYQKIPKGLRRATDSMAALAPSIFPLRKFSSYVHKANLNTVDRFFHYQFYFRDHALTYLTNDFRKSLDIDLPIRIPEQHYERVAECDPLNRLLYLDLKLAIADNDLFKVNRTANIFRIEVVYPYLDKHVAVVSGTIPAHLKLNRWTKRYIFKKAFKTLLPPEILTKKKHGFGLPTGHWLRTHSGFRELARSLLLDQRSIQRGLFSRPALESLIELHNRDDGSYYGSQIWNLMMLELWHRHHHDEKR